MNVGRGGDANLLDPGTLHMPMGLMRRLEAEASSDRPPRGASGLAGLP